MIAGTSSPTAIGPTERDRIEALALAEIFRAAPTRSAARLGIAAEAHGGALMVRVDALRGAREFNRVMGLGPDEPDLRGQLEAAGRFFAGRPHIASLDARAAAGCQTILRSAGYAPGYAWDTFARAPEPPPPATTDLLVRESAPGEARAVADVILSAFTLPPALGEWIAAVVGRPGWTFVVAEDDGVLVGAAAMLIDSGTAWFGLGGTRAAHRGRGAQAALFAARIRAAKRAGCTLLATETGAPGEAGPGPSHRNMIRAGFTMIRRRENWQAPSHTSSAS